MLHEAGCRSCLMVAVARTLLPSNLQLNLWRLSARIWSRSTDKIRPFTVVRSRSMIATDHSAFQPGHIRTFIKKHRIESHVHIDVPGRNLTLRSSGCRLHAPPASCQDPTYRRYELLQRPTLPALYTPLDISWDGSYVSLQVTYKEGSDRR